MGETIAQATTINHVSAEPRPLPEAGQACRGGDGDLGGGGIGDGIRPGTDSGGGLGASPGGSGDLGASDTGSGQGEIGGSGDTITFLFSRSRSYRQHE